MGVFHPPSIAGISVAHTLVAGPASMAAYAHGLYGFPRELDRQGCDFLVASLPVQEGLGLAISSRLRRAARPRSLA